ncbi:MAG: SDR family oxidoreductase [Acidimicrobiia bacterium]
MRIAVTGATGYIGGRLVQPLLDDGHSVVCLARTPTKLRGRPWADSVDVRPADVSVPHGLDGALDGCDVAYYLIHSMGSGDGFEEADFEAATRFGRAAADAGVKRIVYLGGLGDDEVELSSHLSSRHDVGIALATSGVPVTEFRAAVIIGSGSVSFEMLRYLTEVLPAMTTPTWVRTRCQPIAIRDVLAYLVAAVTDDAGQGHSIYEIAGPDILTYEEMMQTYASVAGLPRRLIIPVPVLSPRLSSLWIGLVTPLPVAIARPLVESLRHEVVVRDGTALARFDIRPIGFRESVALAASTTAGSRAPTRWSDAEATSPAKPMAADPKWSGGTMFEDRRSLRSEASAEDLYWAVSRVGGDVGYYGFTWAWRMRGVIDILAGGVGLRRGRRHPTEVRPGDAIDFWRVVAVQPNKKLELSAEMRLPGDAWLVWTIDDAAPNATITQEAFFEPRGLFGRLYWYALVPFHGPIFSRMLRNIASAALNRSR